MILKYSCCLWIGTCGILYKLLSAGLQQFSFCFAATMAVVANREMALSTGIFLNLLAAYTQNWDIHVLMASVLLLLLGTMLALAGKEKHLHLWVQFISFLVQ